MPKVSVIVPNYNHAEYLPRRLDSILGQTFQDFELILLDDHSSDASAEILLSYKNNPRVSRVIINEENSGSTFKQWDRGFSFAKGEYIWIAESDDWCEKTLLQTLVEKLDSDSDISLAFCQCSLVDEQGTRLYRTSEKEGIISGRDFVAKRMFGDMVIVNAGMAVFRKSALEGIDEHYKTMRAAGDWRFWVEIALKGKVYISSQMLAYCFRHSGTVTSASVRDGNDIGEGNDNFAYVRSRVNPSAEEIKNALKLRLRIYLEQIPLFRDTGVRENCKKSVLSLDPSAKWLYLKILAKRFFTRK
ncbi:MAG: glycosyltransferase family 2 protein [Bacteroidales bacterium]|nr:glycosyltransferase family 2 protein [Bacteroidales bacterium]